MNENYNKHYILVREDDAIIEGWSDGPHSKRTATEDDICINDKGGYQFRLFPDGEENPPLFDETLYQRLCTFEKGLLLCQNNRAGGEDQCLGERES